MTAPFGGRKRPVSTPAELLQHGGGGETVGRGADGGLEVAQRLPGFAAELAIRGALVEAALGQELLQLQPFGPRQLALLPRPGLDERRPAAEPVGEMADRQRIGFRRVVFQDDAEILHHQEGGTRGAGRRQQIGLVVRARERLVVGAQYAELLPLRESLRLGAVGEHVIEALRHRDLVH